MPISMQNTFPIMLYIILVIILLAAAVYVVKPKAALKKHMDSDSKENMTSEIISSEKETGLQQSSVELKRAGNDTEIVAAVMAAICAYTGLTMNEIRISSIRRVSDNDSNWRKAGIM